MSHNKEVRRWGLRQNAARRWRARRENGLARYYELYLALSNTLRDGTYAAGDVLPERTGSDAGFRLSRSTVRRALHRLQQEKRIVRRHGSGTYARESPDGERTQFSQSNFFDSARALESTTTTRLLQYPQIADATRY